MHPEITSTGNLTFLFDPLPTSWEDFGETFAVALDIFIAFDGSWRSCLTSKLPAYNSYPSICSLISDFHSNRFIAAIVDIYCYFPTSIAGVPQGSVLSFTLFLLFINDILDCTIFTRHSHDDETYI